MTETASRTAPLPLLPADFEAHLVTAVPRCTPDARVGDLRDSLAGRAFDSADEVVVCADAEGPSRLLGLIPLEVLFAADADATASEVMDADPPVIGRDTNQEQAAWKAIAHGESSLAVLDSAGDFHGLVPAPRLLGALLRDHDETLARLGGYLASTASARLASEEPLGRRLWHRLPWLLVGLAGAAASAWLMGGYEEEMAADVRLAFFVPGVVYMADAVGTQTEALVIRGMSIGTSLKRAFRLEVLTGLAMGVLVGLTAFVGVWAVLGSVRLGAVVGLSLVAACAVATVVAMLLPWGMARLGKDPAFGSGPLATVIQDLLSLVIYFAAALTIMG